MWLILITGTTQHIMAGIAPGLPLKQITMTKQNHSKTHSNLKTCFLSVSSLVYSLPVFQSHLLSSPKLAATANKALRSACCDLAADMSKHLHPALSSCAKWDNICTRQLKYVYMYIYICIYLILFIYWCLCYAKTFQYVSRCFNWPSMMAW